MKQWTKNTGNPVKAFSHIPRAKILHLEKFIGQISSCRTDSTAFPLRKLMLFVSKSSGFARQECVFRRSKVPFLAFKSAVFEEQRSYSWHPMRRSVGLTACDIAG